MTVLEAVVDPNGARVELTSERWRHITEARPYMASLRAAVLRAVAEPTKTMPGRAQDETWFYLRDAGPSDWLKVVVVFEADRGFIVTAFPRRRLP